jgi:hypothetical protein
MSLRIIHGAPMMNHCIMLREASYYVAEEMRSLVAHEVDRASITTPYILV